MTQQNQFQDFLEENPEFLLESAIGGQGNTSPNRQRFFRDQFKSIFGRFQGALADQIQGGEDPTLRFSNFLEDFDFRKFAGGFSPTERGEGQARFAPATRFFFR